MLDGENRLFHMLSSAFTIAIIVPTWLGFVTFRIGIICDRARSSTHWVT